LRDADEAIFGQGPQCAPNATLVDNTVTFGKSFGNSPHRWIALARSISERGNCDVNASLHAKA
jgi:hypothetical protein